MINYLREPLVVSIDDLYPDPNNPRLAWEEATGYEDADSLFNDETRRLIVEQLSDNAFDVTGLVEAIIGQGWMPIDNILVWKHPSHEGYVVVEGNRRRVALERIRTNELERARKKLERMEGKSSTFPKSQIDSQKDLVQRIERIVAETTNLTVVPLDATTAEELEKKLPRVLAVRHITGAKEWGNFAEDLWLLKRYEQLFEDVHGPRADKFWDDALTGHVADEASLTATKARRQLKSASWFSHFRAEWEGELPDNEEFNKTDYYLFENIAKKPWIRSQLGVSDNALSIPPEGEEVLFKWVFRHPRGKTADDNPNVFYRHENILVWDRIKKYDDDNGTSFASRFDVQDPDSAPTMHEVEADYLAHKARRKPHAVLEDLIRRLDEFSAEKLANEGMNFKIQLRRINDITGKYLKMVAAAES